MRWERNSRSTAKSGESAPMHSSANSFIRWLVTPRTPQVNELTSPSNMLKFMKNNVQTRIGPMTLLAAPSQAHLTCLKLLPLHLNQWTASKQSGMRLRLERLTSRPCSHSEPATSVVAPTVIVRTQVTDPRYLRSRFSTMMRNDSNVVEDGSQTGVEKQFDAPAST